MSNQKQEYYDRMIKSLSRELEAEKKNSEFLKKELEIQKKYTAEWQNLAEKSLQVNEVAIKAPSKN